jgi:hypothetical protein
VEFRTVNEVVSLIWTRLAVPREQVTASSAERGQVRSAPEPWIFLWALHFNTDTHKSSRNSTGNPRSGF